MPDPNLSPFAHPDWIDAPPHRLPGSGDLGALLYRSETVLVGINGFQVWPSGCAFILSVRLLPELADQFRSSLQFERSRRTAGRAGQLFEFDVTFADGRTADNRTGDGLLGGNQPPTRPTLAIRGGGSVDQGWDLRWWLWPLPPAGPATFRCYCPAIGIPESTATIAGEDITAAAGRAVSFANSQP